MNLSFWKHSTPTETYRLPILIMANTIKEDWRNKETGQLLCRRNWPHQAPTILKIHIHSPILVLHEDFGNTWLHLKLSLYIFTIYLKDTVFRYILENFLEQQCHHYRKKISLLSSLVRELGGSRWDWRMCMWASDNAVKILARWKCSRK